MKGTLTIGLRLVGAEHIQHGEVVDAHVGAELAGAHTGLKRSPNQHTFNLNV